MKKISVLVFILIGSISNIMAQENSKVLYTAMYRYHHIHCAFMVNNIPLHTSIPRKPVLTSFVGRIGMVLAEGDNTFGIWAMNIPEEPKGAYCEMIITASAYNKETGESEAKEVSSIKVTIDEQGKFIATESKNYPEPSLTGKVALKELDEITFNQGIENDAIATRSLVVNHPHKSHSWSYKSTPFTDTPENREKLWAKYEEFRLALAKKDEKRFRALLDLGLMETEVYMGDPKTRSYTNSLMESVYEAWEAKDFKVLPVNRDDYRLVIGSNGRLFRFVYKETSNKMASPIRYQKNGSKAVFNLTFSLVNGEIINAY